MPYDPQHSVFATIGDFYKRTQPSTGKAVKRIIHCINPFLAKPGTEHDRAQRVTLTSMTVARRTASVVCPEIDVVFGKITLGDDFDSGLIEFDIHRTLTRSVLDLADFDVPRPLPLVMDLFTAVPVGRDDVFIFTNTDIALSSNFYGFVQSVFERGVDCAIINRRTISDYYKNEQDLALMAIETGTPHPGFDCFAMRGELRDKLMPYDSCVGIGGVMLPLVYQLLAFAKHPVVLLDAHATFHLGNDKSWTNEDFADYSKHNRKEIDRIFATLIEKPDQKEILLQRLSGAHEPWIFKDNLKRLAGLREGVNSQPDIGIIERLKLAASCLYRQ